MNTRKIGDRGEDIACGFLSNKGYVVVDRNYLKSWGELDIVATNQRSLHFFEVKSVTYIPSGLHVKQSSHKPEDNVHGLKVRSIRRMIETYLEDKHCPPETEFYFHVLCVFMDVGKRRARVKWIKNIIL
jgi:putative endonuclease